MQELRSAWKTIVSFGLHRVASKAGLETELSALFSQVQIETPPNAQMGDLAFPLFPFAKAMRKGPPQIAAAVAQELGAADFASGLSSALTSTPLEGIDATTVLSLFTEGKLGTWEQAGPYLNVRLDRSHAAKAITREIHRQGQAYGNNGSLAGRKILVEFSSPNTNKPLHLGHLRNNTLGESCSRILRASGAEVKKVNLFNDRGIHICKSMLAYERWGEGKDPAALGLKPDHYVAQLYVRYQNELKTQIAELKARSPELGSKDDDEIWLQTEIGAAAQSMLLAWESGDAGIRKLWETMNSWAIGGIMQTYARTGIVFDWIQYEHETYLFGKTEVEKGLASGAFKKRPDGAIVVDLPWKDNAKAEENAQKVVLRADGTSIYLTQDLGTAIRRNEAWPFDQAVYVVASEQDYHFKVLFHCLKVLGYSWAEKLHHLSYGLVNLPTGRMKTREGTVVDADLLIDELRDLAVEAIKEKNREEAVGDPALIGEKVALAALHYYLIQTSPNKDMIFNPEESLAFSGNTGPYLQYMGARVASLLRKYSGPVLGVDSIRAETLTTDQEWDLLRLLASYPTVVADAAAQFNPSAIASFLYDLAKSFSRFYHDLPILNAPSEDLVRARLFLASKGLQVLRHGMDLLNVPVLEVM